MSRRFYQLLKRNSIPIREWRVLAVLSDDESISLNDLAERIIVEQSSASRLVERMEGKGLLKRTISAEDNRKTLIRTTKKGTSKVKLLIDQALQIEKEFVKEFGAQRSKNLKRDLTDIIKLID